MEYSNLVHLLNNGDVTFPIFPTKPSKKNRSTKINTVVLSLSLSDARVINLILLVLGTSLNLLIILIIVCVRSARTSRNFYIVSLACSNMIILIEPLEEVLKWFFDVNMKLNMDYVCIISFDVSIITIAILKFIQYIGIFRDRVSFGHALLKKYTTVKGILLIWSSCIISLAISLHIYDYFEEDMPDIYICITIMFITMPLIISLSIDALTIYELTILKEIEGSWRMDELRHYIMLVVIAIAFILIRMPYRLARAINFLEPKASCCTDDKREVLYFMAKMYPFVFSLIYISLSNEFHEIIMTILKHGCQKFPREIRISSNDNVIV
ncbi:melatonin receptor type 1B-B-like [Apis mellifera caucasica]|uniref:Melatonin receptor type 1B-B-like n=1 Tax=Apis mellifera TaxID=7460 RepID=A0A7M7IJW9_APIME|nr:melatonin receptor type 1B-B-like [Apis mellifera]KAG6799113.1 melatonin receptor type 1B-B-like [Apis mellifera caucasica]KAG9432366.1 melatonin receptor type 1B-B-like [Apis mellifera carnica]|eukprot:XP_016767367.1 melatonin receptor type 1B-B-like [Apis mellifera]